MTCITLTTDFGTADGYVAAMKGAMLSIAPKVALVDITHAIPPQDVQRAAFVLWATVSAFPPSCVHLVVVDPGVGTERRALACRTDWGTFVGPDNGVLSYVWAETPPRQIVTLSNPAMWRDEVSRTFHGRDLFAPVAAHLAQGVPLEALGDSLTSPIHLPLPRFIMLPDRWLGEVIAQDHFGNLITSIGKLSWHRRGLWLHREPLGWCRGNGREAGSDVRHARVKLNGQDLGPIHHTYGEAAPGELLALVGSSGLLEIAVAHGSAAAQLGAKGQPVTVEVLIDASQSSVISKGE